MISKKLLFERTPPALARHLPFQGRREYGFPEVRLRILVASKTIPCL